MIAYFDCFSGISGDMTLGALMDLGPSPVWLEDHLKGALGVSGFEIRLSSAERGGICGKKADVIVTDTARRDYAAIRSVIQKSALSAFAKRKSLEMFRRIAEAEAGIHGCPVDSVHFHELGGVDAMVDVTGTAVLIEQLGIERIVSSKVATGSGTVHCAHGLFPAPAPATLAILSGIPVYGVDTGCELTTPTGAAIIATMVESFGPVPEMILEGTGYGAGARDLPGRSNLLRIVRGSRAREAPDPVEVIETGIDDMNPEVFGYVTDRLFFAGALDVCLYPVYMKKGRPGTLLQVLCHRQHFSALSDMILNETSAAGLRHYTVGRQVLGRASVFVPTPYGQVAAKRVRTPDGRFRIAPEFEDCKKIAASRNLPVMEIYEAVIRNCESSAPEHREDPGANDQCPDT